MKRIFTLSLLAIAMPFFAQAQELETQPTEQTAEIVAVTLEDADPLGLGFSIAPTIGSIYSSVGKDLLYYGDYWGADLAFEIMNKTDRSFTAKFDLSTKFGIGNRHSEFYSAVLTFGGEWGFARHEKYDLLSVDFGIGFGYNWSTLHYGKAIAAMKWGINLNLFDILDLGSRVVFFGPLNFSQQGFLMVETAITVHF